MEYFVSSATLRMFSFSMMFRRWVSTVLMLRQMWVEISLVDSPSAMSWRISRSREVRSG